MKRKIRIVASSLFLVFIFAFSSPIANIIGNEANAVATRYNFYYELINDGTEYAVTGCRQSYFGEKLVIPSTYNGLSVTAICDNAFKGCKRVSDIYIPESIKNIGESAFQLSFTGTEGISVDSNNPNFLSENGVLFNKDKTELIRFPQMYYEDGSGISEYIIPSSVTKIASSAFYGTYSLKEITIPDGVNEIGDYSFFILESNQLNCRLELPLSGIMHLVIVINYPKLQYPTP